MKFPSMHIAESVVNRILNTWDEIPSPAPAAAPAPEVPNPAPQGAALDQALTTPQGGAPASSEGAAVALAGAQGESPMQGLLGGLGSE